MKNRLPHGGRIDRSQQLSFTFNGTPMRGCAGDTIASALLANGVSLVARSFKYHRPRGIVTAGPDEPNAIFSVDSGGSQTPNVRATLTPLAEGMVIRSQSGKPSLEMDVGALAGVFSRLLPAGFYYKTFMQPARLWLWYEKIIRRAACAAPSPTTPDEDAYLHQHTHCDVLIAGGGPAGIAAALAAARAGAEVLLTDMQPLFGGSLNDAAAPDIDGMSAPAWVEQSLATLRAMNNVTLLPCTTVQGYHDYNYLIALEERRPRGSAAGEVRQVLWKIRAARVVIAAGALERPLLFAGNDVPGVMLCSAVHTYVHRYAVLPGKNMLFFTNNDSAYSAAFAAAAAGARVEIADVRRDESGFWQRQAVDRKVNVHYGCGIMACSKTGNFLSVKMGRLHGNSITPHISHAYDVVAVSGGWTPTVHLFSQARGTLAWNERLGAFAPDAAHPINPCIAAGAANGNMDTSACLRDGHTAGKTAAAQCGYSSKGGKSDKSGAPEAIAAVAEQQPLYLPYVPTAHPIGRGTGKHFVDLANDVTAADILLATREGYQSVEHMKRYTAAGFGTEQGKSGNINALTLLAHTLGKKPQEVGHTTYRPQYTPMSFGAVTGADRRALFAQERRTPMDSWHRAHNAVYEDVGDWKRPRYFPQLQESMDEAVWRECKAARNAVAIMDASTLGKIDIQGADAAAFLDRIYTNQMSTLAVGKCRYGLMLRETGMIFDDGVAARLGDNHYHITTSTGHAAAVMNWLEEWLQTEWQEMRVFCTSVTEQWAVVALVGPRARDLLSEVSDLNLSADNFPFMAFRDGVVCGAPARVFRVSFSGEAAFEINVPASMGLSVWEMLIAKGEPYGITPYGTESMHVLRAEKGYIIVGQDSDGTMIPADVGLEWMLSKKKKDFLGKRSLARPDMLRSGRVRLVGLLPADAQSVIAEGSQLLNTAGTLPPTQSIGFVTSSYMSPTLERSFSLAVVEDGDKRLGDTIYAAGLDDRRIAATITDTVFYDKEGEKLRG